MLQFVARKCHLPQVPAEWSAPRAGWEGEGEGEGADYSPREGGIEMKGEGEGREEEADHSPRKGGIERKEEEM
jgi:hypothetical protein